MTIYDKDEAICYIDDATLEERKFVTKQLSFFYPGYQFMPSFRAGISDGRKKFFQLRDNYVIFPKGLANTLINSCKSEGINYTYNPTKYSDSIPTLNQFTEFIKSLNLPFDPYDYQVQSAFESIVNYRQINLMATGSGKSLTIYIILRWMLKNNLKSVVIVPTIMLTTQLYSDFKDYGWEDIDEYVHLIGGDNKIKHFDKSITISTWQSLQTSSHLFNSVDCIVADECHTVKAETFEKVIFPVATSARYRFGFTGTLPKEAIHKVTILSCLGEEKRYITTRQLIDRGLATNVLIKALFLEYSLADRKELKGKKYQQEVEYITEHPKRNIVLSKIINKISNTVGGGNTIVLFDRKEHGKQMCLDTFRLKYNTDIGIKELMKADNPYGIYYIIGESKSKDREEIRQLLEKNNNCILFGTSSILSTGINIKNLHHLFLTSGGKSSIKLNQSIGRLLRLHASKNTVNIWDIIDDLTIQMKSTLHKNYFFKHFEERLAEYMDNEYEIDEKVIQL